MISKDTFSKLFHSFPGSIVIIDSKGSVLQANQNFLTQFGLENKDISQVTVRFHSDDPIQTASLHYDHSSQPFHAQIETITWDDQTAYWVKAITSTGNDPARVEINESQLINGLFNNVQLIVLILDKHGKIVQFNPYFEQVSGYQLDEVQGKDWFSTFIPDWENGNVKTIFKKALSSQSTRGNINPIKTRFGHLRLIEWYDQQLLNDFGSIEGILAIGIDITQKIQTERALRQNEDLFFQLTENIKDVFWIRDYASREILYVSPAYENVFGRTCESLYEHPDEFIEAIHPEDLQRVQENVINQHEKGEFFNDQYRILHPDGTQRWLNARSFFIRDADNNPIRIVGIAEDITDRREAAERIQRQVMQLAALRQIDISITASPNLTNTLQVLIEQVLTNLHVDAADVLLLDRETNQLRYVTGKGFTSQVVDSAHLRLGKDFADRAVQEKRLVQIPDLFKEIETLSLAPIVATEKFISYYCMPLISKNVVKGVLEVWNRARLNPDEEWITFLEALAGQAAIAVDNALMFADLHQANSYLTRAYDATIEGWARALELRDVETEGHSRRVTELTLRVAREMGLNGVELEHVRRGALLHDVGKMGIPDSILLKPGPLTPQEWDVMRQHPVYAYESLMPIEFLHPSLSIPLYHHEKWNGSGYPHGLSGEEIPLEARIFAIVDVWDALRSHRPYRAAWNFERARDYILGESGRHFDPLIVKAFTQIIENDKLDQAPGSL